MNPVCFEKKKGVQVVQKMRKPKKYRLSFSRNAERKQGILALSVLASRKRGSGRRGYGEKRRGIGKIGGLGF